MLRSPLAHRSMRTLARKERDEHRGFGMPPACRRVSFRFSLDRMLVLPPLHSATSPPNEKGGKVRGLINLAKSRKLRRTSQRYLKVGRVETPPLMNIDAACGTIMRCQRRSLTEYDTSVELPTALDPEGQNVSFANQRMHSTSRLHGLGRAMLPWPM